MFNFIINKIRNKYIWERIFVERLSEPIHLNITALLVAIFGNYRNKINCDLVIRHHNAYSILKAAELAAENGYEKISIIEFGVASGAGLMNMEQISKKIQKITGVEIHIYGFDTGKGMPSPGSYKDHPELYQEGDFPMDPDNLKMKLGKNTSLVLGEIKNTIDELGAINFKTSPIAYIVIDVDYYCSTVDALKILQYDPDCYLPRVILYLDDVEDMSHNSFCGEQAAINEFTKMNPARPIEKHPFLRGFRLFKNARWIDHIYLCHILDHEKRNLLNGKRDKLLLDNPYM